MWCVFQKEEGLIQGQLNHSDSRQYINQLRDQISELKNEVANTSSHHRKHKLSREGIKYENVGSKNYTKHTHLNIKLPKANSVFLFDHLPAFRVICSNPFFFFFQDKIWTSWLKDDPLLANNSCLVHEKCTIGPLYFWFIEADIHRDYNKDICLISGTQCVYTSATKKVMVDESIKQTLFVKPFPNNTPSQWSVPQKQNFLVIKGK